MTVLLVTTPQGREGDGILELEWAIEKAKVKGTGWKGVLLAETPLSREEVLERLRNFETQALQRVIVFDEVVPAEEDEISSAVLRLAERIDGTFAVRVRVRGNKRLDGRRMEISLGSLIVERFGPPVNLSDPDWTVKVEVLGGKAGVGVLRRGELLKFDVVD